MDKDDIVQSTLLKRNLGKLFVYGDIWNEIQYNSSKMTF